MTPSAKNDDELRTDDLRATDQAINTLTFEASARARSTISAPEFSRILVGVDGTGSSSLALAWAKELALANRAKLWVATIMGPAVRGPFSKSPSRGALMQREERIAKEILEKAGADAERGGIEATGVLARGFPALELLKLAEKKRADLVIVGSHGHSGRDRILIGSVADTVKNQAACSVLIAKAPPGPGPVLIPVDGSADSRAAAIVGIRIARKLKAEPQIYHVFEPPVFYDPEDAREQFKHILDDIELPTKPAGIRYLLDLGHPRRRIADYIAQTRPRLVVMGARGLSPLRKLLTGTTTNHVIHASQSAVLLVRRRR